MSDAPHPFRVVDTGGLTPNTSAPFVREIEQQAETALGEAAGILFVVDARVGASGIDIELASLLRRRNKPIILVANKVEGPRTELLVHDLERLGLGAAIAVSAEHGLGVDRLLASVAQMLDGCPAEEREDPAGPRPLSVAIVGRPNVGKSSLLNRLLGEERVVVSERPGTTRDAIDTLLEVGSQSYRLIDTAGIRRRGKVQRGVERFSVAGARKNIERCDVAVLVLDGGEEFTIQDAHIAGHIQDAYKPMLVAVNKWDLVQEPEQAAKDWAERMRRRLRFVKEVPMLLVSARSGQRVTKLLRGADALYETSGRWIPTPALNRWLKTVMGGMGSPATGQSFRVFYGTQTDVHPPRILLFCNDPRRLHFSTQRHLENSLRQTFGFGSAPIRLELRARRQARGQ